MMSTKKVSIVLLTGGSSGIGAATAKILADSGMTVYSASRRGTAGIPSERIRPVALDVTDPEAVRKVVEEIVEKEGHIDAVVCNAGNGIFGPVEGTTPEEARSQFEVCYFGALNCIQACLPHFRKQDFGRIITVTSVMAILQLPFQGFYSSVKAALLSISESLTMELHGTGIQCCSVLPGDVKTGFTGARKMNAAVTPDSPYKKEMDRNLAKIEHDELNGMEPEVIGKAIAKQLGKRKMAVRVIPRLDYAAINIAVRILPERLKLWIIRKLY